jgi:hypothetical protein
LYRLHRAHGRSEVLLEESFEDVHWGLGLGSRFTSRYHWQAKVGRGRHLPAKHRMFVGKDIHSLPQRAQRKTAENAETTIPITCV